MSESHRTRTLAALGPPRRTGRTAAGLSCLLLVLFGLSWTIVCAGATVVGSFALDPGLAVVSAIGAFAFAAPYLAAIMWLDRNEKEPVFLILSALGWGAVVATSISILFNVSFEGFVRGLTGDKVVAAQLAASLMAPVVEELSKAAALFVIYLLFQNHFDNVLDGVIYGALVGLGFAVFENFTYYMNSGEIGAAIGLICLRGVITAPGTHACFTAISGIGCGLFRVSRTGIIRWAFPPLGVLTAMGVHFSWNTFTQLFLSTNGVYNLFLGLPMAVLVLQIPFIAMVLTVSAFALRHEGVLVRRYLKAESPPVLFPHELSLLVPARVRALRSIRLFLRGKIRGWVLVRKRNHLLVELAFEKWHMDREVELDTDAAALHAIRVTEIRRILRALPEPPA